MSWSVNYATIFFDSTYVMANANMYTLPTEAQQFVNNFHIIISELLLTVHWPTSWMLQVKVVYG